MLSFFISSCALSGIKSFSEFKSRWEDSENHSAVSWWYVGETDSLYFINEQWVLMKYHYEIPKSEITLEGVSKMSPCSLCKGVNLKINNVIFNE